MTYYLDLENDEPSLLKVTTKDDEIKELKYKTEKHDHENILKSLKIDSEYYRKKYKFLNKKKIYITILEILTGIAGVSTGSTLSITGVGTARGIPIASSTAFMVSIATLITNEYFSKLKIRYTKLRDHINMITLLYEKTLEKSMKDKKLDPVELDELKKIYNHYLDKRKEIMKNTKFDVKDVFGDIINKDTISPEKITKLNNFSAKMM